MLVFVFLFDRECTPYLQRLHDTFWTHLHQSSKTTSYEEDIKPRNPGFLELLSYYWKDPRIRSNIYGPGFGRPKNWWNMVISDPDRKFACVSLWICLCVYQVAQVYQSLSMARLLQMAPTTNYHHLERLIVECARNNDMQVSIRSFVPR